MQNKRYFRDYYILLSLLVFYSINTIVWLAIDTLPPAWDQATHLSLGLDYLSVFLTPSITIFQRIFGISSYYPPLFHISMIPCFVLFGVSGDSGTLINIFYLGILIFATYGIGKALYSRYAGLLAAFVVSMYPFILYVSRTCLIDLALTSLVTLGMYFLIKSEKFSRLSYSILFGIICGLGMLTKWTFLFFVLPATLFVLWLIFIENCKDRGIFIIIKEVLEIAFYIVVVAILLLLGTFLQKIITLIFIVPLLGLVTWLFVIYNNKREYLYLYYKNALISVFLGLLISGPWYLFNLGKVLRYGIRYAAIGAVEGDPSLFTLESFVYYLKNLITQIHWIFIILLVFGLFFYFARFRRQDKIILVWISIPYVLFSLISNKDLRYTLPFIPAIAILSVFWIPELAKKMTRHLVTTVVLVAGLIHFFLFSYASSIAFAKPPLKQDWQHDAIFNYINTDIANERTVTIVRVMSNHAYFHGNTFEFYTRSNNINIYPKGYRKNLGDFTDYIISKTQDIGPAFTTGNIQTGIEIIEQNPLFFRNTFKQVKKFGLPDGSQAIVYKRDVSPAELFSNEFSLLELESKLELSLKEYFSKTQGILVSIIPYSELDSLKGRFNKICIEADRVRIKDIWLDNFKLVLNNVELNLYELWLDNKLTIFRIEEIVPSFELKEGTLEDIIRAKAGFLENVDIYFDNSKIQISGDIPAGKINLSIFLEAQVVLDKKRSAVMTKINELSIGPFVIPHILYNIFVNHEFPLEPTSSWNMRTGIDEITISEGRLAVEGKL